MGMGKKATERFGKGGEEKKNETVLIFSTLGFRQSELAW